MTMNNPSVPNQRTPNEAKPAAHRLVSRELLQGRNEVLIDHDGATYRLCLTRSGKLILQK